MTRRKAHERVKTKIGNWEATPQFIWPIAKFLTKLDGPRAPTVIHGPLDFIHHPLEKANANNTAWKTGSHTMICDETHARRVEARDQAVLEDRR
jgi:hypothetical protein